MYSCAFCYFAGLWLVASKFGLFKILSRYGLSQIFTDIPEDFPQIKYLYYGLLAYTVVYAVIVYIIYKVTSKAGKEQEVLQQQASEVVNYAEKLNILLSDYIRYAKANNITDKTAEQSLKLIQRQVAALPPAIVRSASMKSNLSSIITELQDQLSPEFDYSMFCSTLESAIDTINSLKRRSVTN